MRRTIAEAIDQRAPTTISEWLGTVTAVDIYARLVWVNLAAASGPRIAVRVAPYIQIAQNNNTTSIVNPNVQWVVPLLFAGQTVQVQRINDLYFVTAVYPSPTASSQLGSPF